MRLSGDVSGSSPHFRSILVSEMRSELKMLYSVCCRVLAEGRERRICKHFLRHYSLQAPEVGGRVCFRF
jgi:hypothetical protein